MSIILDDIMYCHDDRTLLFRHLSCSITAGRHVNLIGNNGAGKSVLMQIITGRLQPAAGTVLVSDKPYYLPQQHQGHSRETVAEALNVHNVLNALKAILEGTEDQSCYDILADQWDIEERVSQQLLNWQLPQVGPHTPMQQLSGGEQTRVLLAGIALHQPSIVLLDEPTNHLDKQGRELLYRFMQAYKGTLLVISHDRQLLQLNDSTLALENGKLEWYGGNYTFYKEQREAQLNALEHDIQHQEKELKAARKQAQLAYERRERQAGRDKDKTGLPKIVANSLRNAAEGSTAKLQLVHTAKMDGINEKLQQQRTLLYRQQLLQLRFPGTHLHKGKILVKASELNYSYANGTPLWQQPLNFQIDSGDRFVIEGSNGSGKTTLLQLMMGKLQPASGELFNAAAEIIYLDQHYSFLDENATVFNQLQQFNSQLMPEHELKSLLHKCQLGKDTWDKKCGQLSGGGKMKVSLCCLLASNKSPDMIILDEPANNLDIASMEVLTAALKTYEGTIILVSHDATLVEEMNAHHTLMLHAASHHE
ncbi:ABC-F family ATP-binding cassette domain-containing protein [Filimonas effusa]|uniref:ABC-F family ATP-binding cassette domain-containing protein n=1 Tax=Filimonas effusa TaxID=2508721 RepID=A0A4Q1DA18_9BACT|nr:ABC-F family ATP-binding cassette domain-containing protein [Filimonas effusa]RXK86224.1 ABC-F family ATP-binding cassette domain-containing protein [Filimonas effusa]